VNTDSALAPSADLLRGSIGNFATGVTVVTTLGPDGEPVGTTATAISSLSLDPPLLLVCLGWQSATLRAILGHRAFGVNVLAASQEHLSANFARTGAAASWSEVPHDRWVSGSPRLVGCLASLECELDSVVTGGDHEIVIGRVRDAIWDSVDRSPLVHWRGRYARLEAR
jgi:flavin reductase (DIM6/NTAB) family NADH-FMN oxidoreductase RutF